MSGLAEMGGGVTVLRVIAATDVTASHANAEVDPRVAALQAFLASAPAGRDIADLTYVLASHPVPADADHLVCIFMRTHATILSMSTGCSLSVPTMGGLDGRETWNRVSAGFERIRTARECRRRTMPQTMAFSTTDESSGVFSMVDAS
jgi:hypothetical protein